MYTLSPRSLLLYQLRLRKNCTVMSLRKNNCNKESCNGTKLESLYFSDHKREIDKTRNKVFIRTITLICIYSYPFTFNHNKSSVGIGE